MSGHAILKSHIVLSNLRWQIGVSSHFPVSTDTLYAADNKLS